MKYFVCSKVLNVFIVMYLLKHHFESNMSRYVNERSSINALIVLKY